MLPALASVALLSLLPHKELRFVFPALPLLTLAGAAAADGLWSFSGKWRPLARLACLGLVIATLLLTVVGSLAAHLNYPGGVALRALHDEVGYGFGGPAAVHLDDKVATTGASRFGEELRGAGWTYDKTDGLTDFSAFDFRLVEWPAAEGWDSGFELVRHVDGYAGLRQWTAPAVAILRRSSD